MSGVAETAQVEKQEVKGGVDRYDFGIGMKRCLVCRKIVLNRGCKECSSRFCGPCFSDHTCTPASSSQEASEVSDTVEESSPVEERPNTRIEEPKAKDIVAEGGDEIVGVGKDSVEEEGEPYPEIVYGAPMPERLSGDKMEKKMKKIIKEGGKRGVEIEGAADMGGLQFFCTTMQEPNGDVDLLYESLKAMNAKSDANEEERKGGSGRVGKMLVSADQDNTKVALVAYSPPAKQGELTADQWMKDMVASLGGGEIVFSDASTAKVEIKNDAEKGLFVLKLKDQAITDSINYLRSKGLFPDNKDDDDSDYVFGDDDFPSAENQEVAEEEAAHEEKDEVVEEAADFGDDPLAMLGGMGEEEVYKVTLMEDQTVEADQKAEATKEEKEEVVEEAADFGDDPLAMLGGMGEEEVYKVTLMEDQAVETEEKTEAKLKEVEAVSKPDLPKEVKSETTSPVTSADTKEEAKTLSARQKKNQRQKRR